MPVCQGKSLTPYYNIIIRRSLNTFIQIISVLIDYWTGMKGDRQTRFPHFLSSRTCFGLHSAKNYIIGFVPRDARPFSLASFSCPLEGVLQPIRTVDQLGHRQDAWAGSPLQKGMIRISFHLDDTAIPDMNLHATSPMAPGTARPCPHFNNLNVALFLVSIHFLSPCRPLFQNFVKVKLRCQHLIQSAPEPLIPEELPVIHGRT